MGKIVVKFGGSNLKSPVDVQRSAEVAAAYQKPLVVVVSAFSGVTDGIITAMEESVFSSSSGENFIQELRDRHRRAVENYLSPGPEQTGVLQTVEARLTALGHLLRGINYIGGIPDFTRDQALSYGERLSSPIVTAVLRSRGIEAKEALPEEIGLMAEGPFGNASADGEQCASRLPRALGGDKTFVVPGFYGVRKDGKIAIFGRGGSDYTAAVIAQALGADSLDLWKDVDGFLSCDPRLVKDSHTISYLTYQEAAELSYFGAKILHPRTVEPLENNDIPIRVMNVERFDGTIRPFSIVGPEKRDTERGMDNGENGAIKSVVSTDDVGIVRLEGPGVGSRPGILARATGKLEAAGLNIVSVITAQTCINLLFQRKDLQQAWAVLKAESVSGVVAVEGLEDVALVAAVGSGIRDTVGVGSRILGALAAAGINVLLAQAGASPVAVYTLVRRKDKDGALRAIHGVL